MARIARTLTRRRFLRTSAAAVAAPWVVPSSVFGKTAPSERITMGCIGVGGMGTNDMRAFLAQPDVQVLAACDPVKATDQYGHWYKKGWNGTWFGREPAKAIVEDHYAQQKRAGTYKGCQATADFREIVTRTDIDAVTVVTPDHWHAPITVMAADHGKDIYCEKPLSLTVAGGRAMVEAVKRNGRILQTGSHQRSVASSRYMCEIVRNGRIGRLKKIEVVIGKNHRTAPASAWKRHPVPEWFDYPMWLGPAPYKPYHPDRCLYKFRFLLDYSGGNVTNLGAHSIDLGQWGGGTDLTGPVFVEDRGSIWPTDGLFDVATHIDFRCVYANGVELTCTTGEQFANVRFIGTDGWIDQANGQYPATLRQTVIRPDEVHLRVSKNHHRNFVDCIKTRQEPAAPVEVGHRSATICHLGNIAARLGAKLTWDPVQERFTGPGSADANTLLSKPMRAPWKI